MAWTAFVDACVLYPAGTRDLLLRGAEAYLYRIRWSSDVLEQVRHHLIDDGRCSRDQAAYLLDHMTTAFPEALVEGYEDLIAAMPIHQDDRHVLATRPGAVPHPRRRFESSLSAVHPDSSSRLPLTCSTNLTSSYPPSMAAWSRPFASSSVPLASVDHGDHRSRS